MRSNLFKYSVLILTILFSFSFLVRKLENNVRDLKTYTMASHHLFLGHGMGDEIVGVQSENDDDDGDDDSRQLQTITDDGTDDRHSKRPENNNSTNGPLESFTTTPSSSPSSMPSPSPSNLPTYTPSQMPTLEPSLHPSSLPSKVPTLMPSLFPSLSPSVLPTWRPSKLPSNQPSLMPSLLPSASPSDLPSGVPSHSPSSEPSILHSSMPSSNPSPQPTTEPTYVPSYLPSLQHSENPSSLPSLHPSIYPTLSPTVQPSSKPSRAPSSKPTMRPSTHPSDVPTNAPSSSPTLNPTIDPCIGRNGSFGLTTNDNEKLFVYYKYSIEMDDAIQEMTGDSVTDIVGDVEDMLLNELIALLFPICSRSERRRMIGDFDSNKEDLDKWSWKEIGARSTSSRIRNLNEVIGISSRPIDLANGGAFLIIIMSKSFVAFIHSLSSVSSIFSPQPQQHAKLKVEWKIIIHALSLKADSPYFFQIMIYWTRFNQKCCN